MSITETTPADAGSASVSRDELLERATAAEAQADRGIEAAGNASSLELLLELRALRLTLAAALVPPEPRADAPSEIQEGWYWIELMGHRTRTGYVRPVLFAGRGLVEIREPEHLRHIRDEDPETIPGKVEFYSPAAIFALSPSTEQEVLESLRDRDSVPF